MLVRTLFLTVLALLLAGCANQNYVPPDYALQNEMDGFAKHTTCNNQFMNGHGYLIGNNCYNHP